MNKIKINNIRRGLRLINRSFGVFDDSYWKDIGISYSMSQLLFAIQDHEGPVMAKDLGVLLAVDKSVISRMLGQLSEKKIVELQGHPIDGRAKVILISTKGKLILKKLNELGDQRMNEILKNLSQREIEQIETIFDKIEKNQTQLDKI